MIAGGSTGGDRGKYKRAKGLVECTNRVKVKYVLCMAERGVRRSACQPAHARRSFTSLRSCLGPAPRSATPVASSWCPPSRHPGGSPTR